MPPKKRFSSEAPAEEPEAPVTKKAKKSRDPVDHQKDLRERLIERLKPAMEKHGGNLGVAEDMEHLHAPKGYTPTGIYGLDVLLSGEHMGLPHGRFIEVFGPESAGKSALCEFFMAAVHNAGGVVHHMDTERTRDDKRIAKCYGLTTRDFIDADPPHLEAVWDYAYSVVKALHEEEAPIPNLLVLDSLAATPSKDELNEKLHEDAHVGLQARSNSKGVRKTVRLFSESSAIFVFVNQQRDKIGAMGYGPKTDTPGGRALKYAYSIRLAVNRLQSIKSGETVVGQLIKVTSQKNKHAPPRMDVELVLSYKTGIDIPASNFLWFQKHKVITPNGKKGFLFAKKHEITKVGFGEWCQENEDIVMNAGVAVVRAKLLSAFDSEETSDDEDE